MSAAAIAVQAKNPSRAWRRSNVKVTKAPTTESMPKLTVTSWVARDARSVAATRSFSSVGAPRVTGPAVGLRADCSDADNASSLLELLAVGSLSSVLCPSASQVPDANARALSRLPISALRVARTGRKLAPLPPVSVRRRRSPRDQDRGSPHRPPGADRRRRGASRNVL